MFEDLDSVNWEELSHSHGSAKDVPQHLMGLAGADSRAREEALGFFWSYAVHQGSRYEVSPYVVPFLFEVLEQASPETQEDLIDLLLALATGLGESFLPYGYDLEHEEKQFAEDVLDGLFVTEDDRSTYYEVHNRAEQFVKFLRPKHQHELRLSAAFAVAHFAQPLAACHEEVGQILAGETDNEQLLSLMLCYGMLGRFTDSPVDTSILSQYLNKEYSKTLRLASAISLATATAPDCSDAAIQTLLTALSETWSVASPREGDGWWNEGDLFGHAALTLKLTGADRRDEVAHALCTTLATVDSCTYSIPETLLDLLFPPPYPQGVITVAEMDTVQRESLKTLLKTNHWTSWMLTRFIPSKLTGDEYRAALQQFVTDVTGGSPSERSLFQRAGNVSSWALNKIWGNK